MFGDAQTGGDREYWRRRVAQERAQARRAVDAAAKRVHLELADLYAGKIAHGA